MKKPVSIIVSLIVVILLTACSGEKVADDVANKYIDKAEIAVVHLTDKNYDELRSLFNSEMKAGLTEAELKQLEPFIEEAGSFTNIDKSSVEKDGEHYVVVLSAKYSDDTLIYTISFNEDDEISGLFVK